MKKAYQSPNGWQPSIPIDLPALKKKMTKLGYIVYIAKDKADAKEIFFKMLAQYKPKDVSWGGSKTMEALDIQQGLADRLVPVIKTSGADMSAEEKHQNRRLALLSDMFVTGANAITIDGQIVNLDGTGNRVAAMAFGPNVVVVVVGRNKIVDDLPSAMDRVKNYASPLNTQRFDHLVLPCRKDKKCHDCAATDRICNVWTITERPKPAGRIRVILIDEDLGY